MPRTCCVPSCKSNYKSTLPQTVSTFSFPKETEMKNKWLNAIPRKDWQPSKYACVCALHFHKSDFVSSSSSKNPKLACDAVPSIFPNLPHYLSTPEVSERKNPNVRRQQVIMRQQEISNNFLEADIINNFTIFLKEFESKLSLDGWHFFKSNSKITFYILCEDDDKGCQFSVRISLNKDMIICIFLGETAVSPSQLCWLLPKTMKLNLWSQMINLLARYKFDHNVLPLTRDQYITTAYKYLQKAREVEEDDENSTRLDFVSAQVKLLQLKRPRPMYDSTVIVPAFIFFAHSAATYEYLRKFLVLPCKRYLQFLSSSMHLSPNYKNTDNDEAYMSHMIRGLNDREKIVALLIDEIYIERGIQYKSNNLVGFAQNQDMQQARTVMSFMVKSVFGSFKDIIRLIPVLNPSGETLKELPLQVVHFAQQIGFRVLVIITDNNRINQSMFKMLCGENLNYFINPLFPNEVIYVQYDTVHLLKNFRNNWLNVKNFQTTLTFSDFETGEVKRASFDHIRNIYFREQNLQIKKAVKLNFKTISPNNLERQSVQLANNVFHESTIAALNETENARETAEFCLIIHRWWSVVNVKTISKATAKRDEWCAPFSDTNDFRIQFLKQFISWLHTWNHTGNTEGTFTSDTYQAAVLSTTTLLDILSYSLNVADIKYVLTGKFQTDDLEARFRLYRSIAGRNYNVSYTEVVESEKKIRLHKIFLHGDHKDYERLANDSNENSLHEPVDISPFESLFASTYLETVAIDISANLYAAGYASHALAKRISCSECIDIIVQAKGSFVEDEYFDFLQRGGLSIPTVEVKVLLFHMCAILQEILQQSSLSSLFFNGSNQKSLLSALTLQSLLSDNFVINFDRECSCGSSNFLLYSNICHRFANILLNNYSKSIRDTIRQNEDHSDRRLLKFK